MAESHMVDLTTCFQVREVVPTPAVEEAFTVTMQFGRHYYSASGSEPRIAVCRCLRMIVRFFGDWSGDVRVVPLERKQAF